MSEYAIFTDTTLCTGCEACVSACKREYQLGDDRPWRRGSAVDDLSATRLTTIVRRPGGRHVRRHCRHCNYATCIAVCLVGAMRKTPEGAVVYDKSRCMGCRYCIMACPFGVPRYEWNKAAPVIRKCTMCYDRLRAGQQPACTEACPEHATLFGPRDEMLALARQRLEAEPKKYVQKIWGEKEIGGTLVFYISDIPLDFLAWKPNLPETPYPTLTQAALNKVPGTIAAVGGAMTGIYWLIGRRMQLQALRAAKEKSKLNREESRDDEEKP
ncbi:MAG: 4Fe-4S dicluster domain-containing protein [Candidatus Sumerlaeia bacterium]|nr:4Fe-4S dicluster domain-containing protein [Candidatus Sumerlaeia bacterium]